ncbi:MAG: PQQ-binding-like beta-propeller repeat protein [Planctomycetota bacterium]
MRLPLFLQLASRVLLAGVATSAAAGDFLQFRGGQLSGTASQEPLPLEWSAEKNIAWKIASPAAGWAQPLVVGKNLYVTGAVSQADLRPANFANGVKSPQSMGISLFSRPPKEQLTWKLFCLSTVDGRILWEQTVAEGQAKFPIHPSNSWATETPAADADGVYVYSGAAGVVSGFSHSGQALWKQDVGVFRTSNSFGTGSSLAIHSGSVFVQNLNEEQSHVWCLDTRTGTVKWKFARTSGGTSWSTPLIWTNARRVELIVSGGDQVDSLDPATGAVNWTIRNVKAATACSPCADGERLYFGGSDPFSKGPLVAVSAGASGELVPEEKNGRFDHCVWLQERLGPGMASPLSTGKYLYTNDNNILRCFDAASGEKLYQTRIPGLDMLAASPLLIGDHLLLLDENGRACIVKVGPEFEKVGEGQLDDVFWATPAIGTGAIFLRGVESIYCIRR